jgi:hypothetical protein
MADVQSYLDEVQDLSCAPLLRLLLRQVAALDPELQSDIGHYGVRFRWGERTLCEFSVFGELFIARVGPHGAVEYRVRDADVAFAALDHVLRDYLELRAGSARGA